MIEHTWRFSDGKVTFRKNNQLLTRDVILLDGLANDHLRDAI